MKRCGRIRRVSALAVLVLAAALVLLASLSCRDQQPEAAQAPVVARPSHPALFFDEATFFKAVGAADSRLGPEGLVAGGVIPHHWLAGHLITAFFRGLAEGDPPETIVLIGPNHANAGSARVLTSDLAWATPFGQVEPAQEWIRRLSDNGLVEIESSVLTTEHSVAGIMPAIKYYLPEARVVPLILSGDLTGAEARRLSQALVGQWNEGVVLVSAVDFSHYLVQSEAERYDAITLDALRTFDTAALSTFDDRYLDSPASIAVLMHTMLELGEDEFVLLENTNSGALAEDQLVPTTSYIVGYYRPSDSPNDGQLASLP